MRDYVLLILPSLADAPLQWALCADKDVIEFGETPFSDVGQIADKNLPIVLVMSGQNIQTFSHDLPKMNRKERAQAILYSIEDNLSTSLDNLHIALKDDEVPMVSVVDTSLMVEIRNWASLHGLRLRQMIADYDALSLSSPSPIRLSDRVIVPGRQGHTLDPNWYEGEADTIEPSEFFSLIVENLPNTTNLMQGDFTPKSTLGNTAKIWTQLGSFVAALGIAFLLFQTASTLAVQAQANKIRAQTKMLYTQATGQGAPDNPARAVIQAQKNGDIAPLQFLMLSNIAFEVLRDFEDVTIERMTFQNSRHELQMRFIYPSFERAEDVKNAMDKAGGNFIPGGVREQSGRFVGEAVLQSKGGR